MALRKDMGRAMWYSAPLIPTTLRIKKFENFQGFSRFSRKFSKFENENEGNILMRIFLRVILDNSRNSRVRMRVTFSRVLATLVFSTKMADEGENWLQNDSF